MSRFREWLAALASFILASAAGLAKDAVKTAGLEELAEERSRRRSLADRLMPSDPALAHQILKDLDNLNLDQVPSIYTNSTGDSKPTLLEVPKPAKPAASTATPKKRGRPPTKKTSSITINNNGDNKVNLCGSAQQGDPQ
jgi:hypothetical protein